MSATLTPSPAPRTGRESLFSPAYRALTIGAVALVALFAFEALAVGTAMPTVAAALDGIPLYAIAFAAPFAAGVLAFVASGIWCDARGPARPILYGVGWFVTGLVIAGTAPADGVRRRRSGDPGFRLRDALGGALRAGRQGVPGGAAPADLRGLRGGLGGARAGRPRPGRPDRRVRRLALGLPAGAAARGAGGAAGPARAAAAGAPVRERVPADARARIGWAAGAAVGAALLHYGGQQRGALAVVGVTVALVSLLVCVPRLMPPGFLRAARGLPTVIGLRGLAGAAFFGAEAFIPLLLTHERGFEPAQAGLALTVGAPSSGRSAPGCRGGCGHRGRGRPCRERDYCWSLSAAMLVAAVLLPWMPVAVVMAGWGVAALGMGLAVPGPLGADAGAFRAGREGAQQFVVAAVRLALQRGGARLQRRRSLAGAAGPAQSTFVAGFGLAVLLALLGAALAGRVVPRTG